MIAGLSIGFIKTKPSSSFNGQYSLDLAVKLEEWGAACVLNFDRFNFSMEC